MELKRFPIRTATSCQLKWSWSTLYLHESKSAACHRTGFDYITTDSFDSFHNTPKKVRERQAMLQGAWPESSCEYCKNIENSNGVSDRLRHLDIPGFVPAELERDPAAVSVTPTILEVYFDNACNMACLYCSPFYSSKIHQENVKFGEFRDNGVELIPLVKNKDQHRALVKKFWAWMHDHSRELKRFCAGGGEPFHQPEFFHMLNFLEKNPHPDLEFSFITNLKVSRDKLESVIARLKALLAKRWLRCVNITCSIDCWGAEQEYVRWGMDINQWERNFLFLLGNKWLTININQTISVLTIKTMPILLQKLSEWRQTNRVGHFFSGVYPGPKYLMIDILGPKVFRKDFDSIIELMPIKTEQDQAARQYMQGLIKFVNASSKNLNEMNNLKIFLDEKDRRRGTNWQETFPWLVQELENLNVV